MNEFAEMIARADETAAACRKGDPWDIVRLYALEGCLAGLERSAPSPVDSLRFGVALVRVQRAQLEVLGD